MDNVIGVMGVDFTVNYFYQLMQQVFPECAESLCVNYWECFRYTVTSLTCLARVVFVTTFRPVCSAVSVDACGYKHLRERCMPVTVKKRRHYAGVLNILAIRTTHVNVPYSH